MHELASLASSLAFLTVCKGISASVLTGVKQHLEPWFSTFPRPLEMNSRPSSVPRPSYWEPVNEHVIYKFLKAVFHIKYEGFLEFQAHVSLPAEVFSSSTLVLRFQTKKRKKKTPLAGCQAFKRQAHTSRLLEQQGFSCASVVVIPQERP